jgi:hypothetical protein
VWTLHLRYGELIIMAITRTYDIDPRWLPADKTSIVWTDFEDASLVEQGTILFDHQSWAMYYGEIIGWGKQSGIMQAYVHWYKAPDNIIAETIRMPQLEAAARHGIYYWADPVMQEV